MKAFPSRPKAVLPLYSEEYLKTNNNTFTGTNIGKR